MDTESNSPLHLPSLKIRGFRGFDSLTIPRLGRVTLLAGRNGTGKTTVLDAVRLLAARGRPSVLSDLLQEREEFASGVKEDRSPATVPDAAALFHGRGDERTSRIGIGPADVAGLEDAGAEKVLAVEVSSPGDWSEKEAELVSTSALDLAVAALRVRYGDWSKFVPGSLMVARSWSTALDFPGLQPFPERDWPKRVLCQSLGPGLPDHLIGTWGSVALTEDEEFLAQALEFVLDRSVDRIAVVDDGDNGGPPGFRSTRRVIVRLGGQARPVPLKSFGDGATRLFGAALALTSTRNGLLVIDEAENGLHHTVHQNFWRMVLGAAREGDIQVLATTHSWDCIAGFARAAKECEHADGLLLRLERSEQGCRAVVYSEEELAIAAEQRIEVR